MSNAAAASNASAIAPGQRTAEVGEGIKAYISDSWVWLSNHWLQIAIAAAVGTGIVLLLYFLRGLGQKLCERDVNRTGWPSIFGRAIARTGGFFIVMVAARLVAGYAQPPSGVMRTIEFLWTLAAVFQAAIWAREIILGTIAHRTQSEHYQGEALANAMGIIRLLVTVALFAIALIVVLDNLGVNVTGLVAGLGVGGIAIGLAAQGIFSDLFAALAILFDKPFKRGDAIAYDTSGGTVEAIGLKSTRIRSITGEERVISNKQLLDKEIQNNTRRDHRRYKFALGATYETPIEKLRAIPDMMREVVEANDATFVRCGFVNFGASSLDYELEFDSMEAGFDEGYHRRHAIGLAVIDRWNSEGIAFAYPTQTSYTAAPDGTMVLPYPEVQPVRRVDKDEGER